MQVAAQNKIIVAFSNGCLCYQTIFLIQQMVPFNTFPVTQCSPLLLRIFSQFNSRGNQAGPNSLREVKCTSSLPLDQKNHEAEHGHPAGVAGPSQPGAELALGIPSCTPVPTGMSLRRLDSTQLCREPVRQWAQTETREVQAGKKAMFSCPIRAVLKVALTLWAVSLFGGFKYWPDETLSNLLWSHVWPCCEQEIGLVSGSLRNLPREIILWS